MWLLLFISLNGSAVIDSVPTEGHCEYLRELYIKPGIKVATLICKKESI